MPNPGQPTIGKGSTGDAVRRAQRAVQAQAAPSADLIVSKAKVHEEDEE